MNLAIKVKLNKVSKDLIPLFHEAIPYFTKHGVDLHFIFEKSDIKSLYVDKGFMYGATPDPTCDVTFVVYKFTKFPTTRSHYDKGVVYLISAEYDDTVGITKLAIPHEIMHYLVDAVNKKGAKVRDVMDTYFMNTEKDFENVDSNFSTQWRLLAPYMGLLEATKPLEPTLSPTATITRETSTAHETLGVLTATNGIKKFKCETLELPWLENKRMVSCIPKGIYQVKKVFWPRKLAYFYQVQNVPGRSGIFIHEGNFFFNYEGCIGLGQTRAKLNSDTEIDITNTVSTIKAFNTFMENKPFILTIK